MIRYICNTCGSEAYLGRYCYGCGHRVTEESTTVSSTGRTTMLGWRVHNVSGKPEGTIGYADGNRMEQNLENKLRLIELAGTEEVVSVSIVSSTTAYIVTKEARIKVPELPIYDECIHPECDHMGEGLCRHCPKGVRK